MSHIITRIDPPIYEGDKIVRDTSPFKYYYKIGSIKDPRSGSRLHRIWLWANELNLNDTTSIWPEYISFHKESDMFLFYLYFGEDLP